MDINFMYTYHAPTTITAPMYAVIVEASSSVEKLAHDAYKMLSVTHEEVREVTSNFARTILTTCPPTPDKDKALDSCRLIRMSINELVANKYLDRDRLYTQTLGYCREARWWACSSIALYHAAFQQFSTPPIHDSPIANTDMEGNVETDVSCGENSFSSPHTIKPEELTINMDTSTKNIYHTVTDSKQVTEVYVKVASGYKWIATYQDDGYPHLVTDDDGPVFMEYFDKLNGQLGGKCTYSVSCAQLITSPAKEDN